MYVNRNRDLVARIFMKQKIVKSSVACVMKGRCDGRCVGANNYSMIKLLRRIFALGSFHVAFLLLHHGSRDTGKVDRLIPTTRVLDKVEPYVTILQARNDGTETRTTRPRYRATLVAFSVTN
jgi:hypothetical protein